MRGKTRKSFINQKSVNRTRFELKDANFVHQKDPIIYSVVLLNIHYKSTAIFDVLPLICSERTAK